MSQVLADFGRFEKFIKEVIKKQLDLSMQLCKEYPGYGRLHEQLHLLLHIYDSNFRKVLAALLHSEVTINQFPQILDQVLNEQFDISFTN